ncbi:MAG: hypothetical protein ACI9Y1_000628 [Lentisphaeria bacterium]|jgi:hypothetical protein
MELAGLLTFFSMGLALGLVHAFDPDHLAAIGGMAVGQKTQKVSSRRSAPSWFVVHWSLGHGGILLVIAALVFLLGFDIPTRLSHFAEASVSLILIVIGVHGFWRVYRAANAATATPDSEQNVSDKNAASFVGMVHGTAGSAPLLTLVPLTQIHEPVIALVYVLLFSSGVTLAMMGFGTLLCRGLKYTHHVSASLHMKISILLSSFSLFFGIYLLF